MKGVCTLVFYLQYEASGNPCEASEYETFEVLNFHLAKALCNTACYSVGWVRFLMLRNKKSHPTYVFNKKV